MIRTNILTSHFMMHKIFHLFLQRNRKYLLRMFGRKLISIIFQIEENLQAKIQFKPFKLHSQFFTFRVFHSTAKNLKKSFMLSIKSRLNFLQFSASQISPFYFVFSELLKLNRFTNVERIKTVKKNR
jgi:hypothetical protein